MAPERLEHQIHTALKPEPLPGIPTGLQFPSLKVVQEFLFVVFFFSNKSLSCIYDLPQTHDPPASGFQTLGMKVCTILLVLVVSDTRSERTLSKPMCQ